MAQQQSAQPTPTPLVRAYMSNCNPKKNAPSTTADAKPYKPVLGNCYPALSFQFMKRLRKEMLIAIGDERDSIGDNFFVGHVEQDTEDHEETLVVSLLGESGVVCVRYVHGNGHIWYNEGGDPPKMHGLKGVGVIPTSGEFVREEDRACPKTCAQLVVNFLLRGVAPWDHDNDDVQSDDKSPEVATFTPGMLVAVDHNEWKGRLEYVCSGHEHSCGGGHLQLVWISNQRMEPLALLISSVRCATEDEISNAAHLPDFEPPNCLAPWSGHKFVDTGDFFDTLRDDLHFALDEALEDADCPEAYDSEFGVQGWSKNQESLAVFWGNQLVKVYIKYVNDEGELWLSNSKFGEQIHLYDVGKISKPSVALDYEKAAKADTVKAARHIVQFLLHGQTADQD